MSLRTFLLHVLAALCLALTSTGALACPGHADFQPMAASMVETPVLEDTDCHAGAASPCQRFHLCCVSPVGIPAAERSVRAFRRASGKPSTPPASDLSVVPLTATPPPRRGS